MSDNSNIGWTQATWQLTAGCLMKSPGCANCYAQTMANRLRGMARKDQASGRDPKGKAPYLHVLNEEGRWNGRVITLPDNLRIPLGWKRGRMIFVDSMSDLFFGDEDDQRRCESMGVPFEPVPFDFIDQAFAVAALCPQHTFQFLTKRTGRMAEYMTRREISRAYQPCVRGGAGGDDASMKWKTPCDRVYTIARQLKGRDAAPALVWPLPNVWIGTSVEDQPRANLRVPQLLECPAAVRFLSCEPLLGPIDLRRISLGLGESIDQADGPPQEHLFDAISSYTFDGIRIDWVIAGCESNGCGLGRGAEHYADWAGSLIDQCAAAGAAFFNKQMPANGRVSHDPSFWPEKFRVQQMPVAATAARK